MIELNDSLLAISQLGKTYRHNKETRQVLDDVSFQVQPGEIVSIVGPSGCGKSTLLHLIAGFDQAYQGQILFAGQTVKAPSTERGMIFQTPQLFSWLRVRDNLAFGLKRRKIDSEEMGRRVSEALEQIGMKDFGHYYPDQLSGGMQQRVALARTLVMQPRLLLMDEPFSALDDLTRANMVQLTLDLWADYKPAIVFVTHNIEEAILMADRIYVMRSHPGSLVQEVPVTLSRPRNFTMALSHEFLRIKMTVYEGLMNRDS